MASKRRTKKTPRKATLAKKKPKSKPVKPRVIQPKKVAPRKREAASRKKTQQRRKPTKAKGVSKEKAKKSSVKKPRLVQRGKSQKKKVQKKPKVVRNRFGRTRQEQALFNKRSAAAKRGAETRRRQKEEESFVYVPQESLVSIPIGPEAEYNDRVKRIESIKKLNYGDVVNDKRDYFEGYTRDEYVRGYLKRDGSVAKHYSSLRWELAAEAWLERLREAEEMGEREFRDEVNAIAGEADVNKSEVYTFFKSN
jgi:hypothetical protein